MTIIDEILLGLSVALFVGTPILGVVAMLLQLGREEQK